jgi:hypothetical protein
MLRDVMANECAAKKEATGGSPLPMCPETVWLTALVIANTLD